MKKRIKLTFILILSIMAACAPQGINPTPAPTSNSSSIPVSGSVTKTYSLEKAFRETAKGKRIPTV